MATKQQERRYHAVEVTNKWTSDSEFNHKPLVYREVLTSPLLTNCGEWEVGVDRFDLDSGLVPIWYFPVLPNKSPYFNTDWTVSNLVVSLEYGGITFSQRVEMIRRDFQTDIPNTPAVGADWDITPQHYVYDVDHIVEMLNKAFTDAYTGLDALILLPAGSVAPRVVYNQEQTLSILVTQTHYPDTLVDPIKVWFNKLLNNLFGNLYTDSYDPNETTHREERLIVIDTPERETTIGGVTFIDIEQNYPNLFSICPFRYMEIRSPLLAVTKETHNTYDLANPQSTVSKSVQSIMIDFELILANMDSIRGSSWVYVSRGKPNWVTMQPREELRRIDLAFYLRDSSGNYIPLRLDTGQSSTLKLVFRKKKVLLR